MKNIKELFEFIKNEEFVYIQTHNFPDHDSIASAFGLMHILKTEGIKSHLIYEGVVQRDSLKEMIRELEIPIKSAKEYQIREKDKIIIVDGCKGNKNVTDLIGEEVAVIDHHETESPDDVKFSDIRPSYGACSSIIFSYFDELKLEIPRDVATALMIGLEVDTSLMTRGVSEDDVVAYSGLYVLSDMKFVNSLLRNYIQVKDLEFYKMAIEKVKIKDKYAFCYFDAGCNQNLLGIIGDFFLSINEVDFVFLCANNNSVINFSLRSEMHKWNAAIIVQEVLKGIGFGGGHSDMAGGIIKDKHFFTEDKILARLSNTLKKF
jgi:nanoRNase/pAp phosphatase (c-di-AMP/oligoRNAs hydrolase)